MMYLVVMPYSWGRGSSIAEADANARKAGGHARTTVRRLVYAYDPKATPEFWVNDMGGISWVGERPRVLSRDVTAKPEPKGFKHLCYSGVSTCGEVVPKARQLAESQRHLVDCPKCNGSLIAAVLDDSAKK